MKPYGRRLGLLGPVVVASLAVVFGLQAVNLTAAHADTSQFHGVNWADPNDNFVTGNITPVGLSNTDTYATTYAKATSVLKGFKALGANSVRMGINRATVTGSWWNSYAAAFDTASDLGMNVVVAPWLQNGTIGDTTTFYSMWDVVINKYLTNGHIYFDIANEPAGYSATDEDNVMAAWVAHYPNIPRGRIIVPGYFADTNLCTVGADSRLNGTLLSIHDYTLGGQSHPTEAAWSSSFESNICGYDSRAVLTEFGVPMTSGVDYNGARDGTNDVSYLYAMTDTVRKQGMGSILWVGVKNASQTMGPGPWPGTSTAITNLNGTAPNYTLTVTNQSGLDRLQYGWGPTGTPSSAPPSSMPPSSTPPSSPAGGRSCTASYAVVGQWQGGFQATVTVTAGSSAISGWTVGWSFPNGQSITQSWNATVSTSGAAVIARNVGYNGALGADANTQFGFLGTWNGTNAKPAVTCTAD